MWYKLGAYADIIMSLLAHLFPWSTQVLIAVASNLIWYGSLAPSVAEIDGISIRLWRGFTVVISSLAIFGRLFFNSAQVEFQSSALN